MLNLGKNILVVGAGLSGVVIARELAEHGFNVTVIDKRNHIAGNVYDCENEHGIRIHKYGPHLFHTSNEVVINWIKKFSEWIPYYHRVKALLQDGSYVPFPVNLETRKYVSDDQILDIFYKPYTLKMWGIELEKLNPEIINRVPMRDDNNDLYFPKDSFQALPKYGYTEFVKNILDHKFITVQLNTKFEKNMELKFDHIFNSMPIDEFYQFQFGYLPYRSMKFHNFDLPLPKILPSATVNFTHSERFTRVTEWKQLPGHGSTKSYTTITIEEPCSYEENNMERFYPIKDLAGENVSLYKKYRNIPNRKISFIGRCGLYAYLDMHQAINIALSEVRKFMNSDSV